MSLRDKFPKLSTRGIIVAVISVIIIGASIGIFAWIRVNREYSYGFIVVKQDSDFTKRYGFPGSGTNVDPYRIENLTISNEFGYGIHIYDTTSYFIIQNCTITGNAGIYVHNIATDTCTIRNNVITVLPDSYGIGLESASNSIIEDNVITADNRSSISGLTVFKSTDCLIANNTISNLSYGIEIWGNSNDVVVTENSCTNCNIGILIDGRDWYNHPVGFNDGSILRADIEDNICNYNSFGIYFLSEVSESTIELNNCSFNTIAGIECYKSTDILVEYNYLQNNTQGISLVEVDEMSIDRNQIEYNLDYAINATESTNLLIYYNNFIENNKAGLLIGEFQAYDDNPTLNPTGENNWYLALDSEGNYWSDLTWTPTANYTIDGGDNIDLFPLQIPN